MKLDEIKEIKNRTIHKEWRSNNHFLSTFRLGSSLPANANKRVVFPELGGPKSKVNLQKKNMHKNLEYGSSGHSNFEERKNHLSYRSIFY